MAIVNGLPDEIDAAASSDTTCIIFKCAGIDQHRTHNRDTAVTVVEHLVVGIEYGICARI